MVENLKCRSYSEPANAEDDGATAVLCRRFSTLDGFDNDWWWYEVSRGENGKINIRETGTLRIRAGRRGA